jgi:DNA-binding response OmpR family regulator/thioredoxin-like negative regulator of GroEL
MANLPAAIIQRSAQVAVVADALAVRQELAAVLRDMGFRDVISFVNAREIRRHLQQHRFQWVVLVPSVNSASECVEMIADLALQFQPGAPRISLIHDQVLFQHIPNLFALGLFSIHQCAITREAMSNALRGLDQRIRAEQGQEANIAAHYLREHYRLQQKFSEWIDMEKRLVQAFPNNPRHLVHLGAGLMYAGHEERGVTTMAQAVYLNPKLEHLCREEFERFRQARDTGIDPTQVGQHTSRRISRCLIVDSDPAVRKQLTGLMEQLKIPLIYTAEDGEDAWKWIQVNKAPEIMLTEWRLPKVSGMALIQRLRSAGYHDTTVCIVSSLVKREDLALLNEMTVAHLITKPIQRDDAILGLRWVMRQERRPTEQKALERRITAALAAGRMEDAEEAASAYCANSRISDGRKSLVRAQLAYARQDYQEATKLIQQAISQSGSDSLSTITLLAQSLLKQGDTLGALRCYERAQAINPQNIHRICELAELHLLDGHTSVAENVLSAARKIDAQNADVVRTEAKAAILSSARLQDVRDLMMQSDARADIVSFMNNRAVTLINEGKYSEACQLYERTLASLPESENRLSGAVYYNLGLAHARHQNLQLARTALQQAAQQRADNVVQKAQSLLSRVEHAIATGSKLVLKFSESRRSAEEGTLSDDSTARTWRQALAHVKPGDYCLMSIIEVDARDQELDIYLTKTTPEPDLSAA